MRQLFRAINLLLPLLLFVVVLLRVREMFDEGEALVGILVTLGAVAVLAAWESALLRLWVLPVCGRAISERVYEGSYSPEDDPLVALAEHIRHEHDRALLSQLEVLVDRESSRPRAWSELASVLADEFHDYEAALQAFLTGATKVPRKEDRALFLCRAAHLCAAHLQDPTRAAELYAEAARRYPATAYGRQAARRSSGA